MENEIVQLRFRKIDKDIFEAVRDGSKKVETRAATPRFVKIKRGDIVKLVCGKDSFEKRVKNTKTFKTISAMLRKHSLKEINPLVKSKRELENMYDSFPNYREKIKKYGLMALELKSL